MPRIVDHEQRRALIAETFQALVPELGVPATTFTRVAEAAGISVGLIQHYFENKEALLQYTYADCLRRRDERIAQGIAEGEREELAIRDILARVLPELLPLDEQRLREHHVTQGFLAQALHDRHIARIAAQTDGTQHTRLAGAVRNGMTCGEVDPAVDPEAAASRILATVYGISTRVAVVGREAAQVDDSLRPVLAQVFTGECRHHRAVTTGVSTVRPDTRPPRPSS